MIESKMSAASATWTTEIALTLNTASGILHLSQRCAGRDTRFHYRFTAPEGEALLGFLYMPFKGLCRKCLKPS